MPLPCQLSYSLKPRTQRYRFTGMSRCTLWQEEQNSAVCVRMNGLRKVRRCGSGLRRTMKSCRERIRILAGGELMQPGIFKIKVGLAHGAFHLGNAVTHHAAEARASRGMIDDLLDRRIEHAAVEQSRVVAAGAPFGRANSGDVLHVLDTLAVPLIVERREVVHRAVPLLVDIGVAALAGIGLHEIAGRDLAVVLGLRGTREKVTGWAVAFAVHRGGRLRRVGDAECAVPRNGARPPGAIGDGGGEKRE